MRTLWVQLPLALLLVAACQRTPPADWVRGGAALVIEQMSWKTGDGRHVDVTSDGHVTIDGHLLFVVDRAGRVYNAYTEPVAVLLHDGTIEGSEGRVLGQVGVTNASPPEQQHAWLAVLPDGNVLAFDGDGKQLADGAWRGCDGPQHRTCTLVSHLLYLLRVEAANRRRVHL